MMNLRFPGGNVQDTNHRAGSLRNIPNALLMPVLAIGFLVTLPVLLPVVLALLWLDRRRLLLAAASSHCRFCGCVLGEDSVVLADAKWADIMAKRQDESLRLIRRVKLRMVRNMDAICRACGAIHIFDRESRIFHPLRKL